MYFDYAKFNIKEYRQKKLKSMSKVIPSPFFVDRGIYSKDVVAVTAARVRIITTYAKRGDGEFAVTHNMFFRLMQRTNSLIAVALLGYIGEHLPFNTNKIILNYNDSSIKEIVKDKKEFYKAISFLEEFVYINGTGDISYKGIIRRTTKPHVYVVNHEILFKGSYDDFVTTYVENYSKTGVVIDNKGRVVLDKKVKYE